MCIRDRADTARLLVEISYRSREEAKSGMSTMDKATEGLNRASQSIQSSAEIIDALGRRADDIGKIIEVIDDLAEQTNLDVYKRQLSISVGTSDPQSTATNGICAKGPRKWMARATSSLPVPLSPVIRTGVRLSLRRETIRRTS